MPGSEWILFGVLGLMLVFMIVNSRKRMKQMKADQAEKSRQTIPGARVMLQGGLFGTVVAYDPDNLDQPAVIEIAPGVTVEVHSQAIVRIVSSDEDELEDEVAVDDADVEPLDIRVETPEETAERLKKREED